MKKIWSVTVCLLLAFFLGGCSDNQDIAAPEPTEILQEIVTLTPTPTATPEPTLEPTATPELTLEPTSTPEPTPTATPEPTPTATPEPTPTATPEPTPTATPEPTPTATPEPTPTATPEPTPTATPEPTPTAEPMPTKHQIDFSSVEHLCGGNVVYSTGDDATIKLGLKCNMVWIDGGDDKEPDTEMDENGVRHIIWNYECQKCPLTYTRDYVMERDGCNGVGTEVYTFYNDGEEIESATIKKEYTFHNSNNGLKWELLGDSCTDGITLTEKCDCGHEETKTQYAHYIITEVFFDSTMYEGTCGGKIMQYACPCRGDVRMGNELRCGKVFERVEEEMDGVTHRYTIFDCDNCDIKYVIDSFTVTEGGISKEAVHWMLYVGEKLVAEITKK